MTSQLSRRINFIKTFQKFIFCLQVNLCCGFQSIFVPNRNKFNVFKIVTQQIRIIFATRAGKFCKLKMNSIGLITEVLPELEVVLSRSLLRKLLSATCLYLQALIPVNRNLKNVGFSQCFRFPFTPPKKYELLKKKKKKVFKSHFTCGVSGWSC